MKLVVCAVGRLRAGPERTMVDDYLARCHRTGRALSIGPVTECQIDDRKGGGPAGEARLLRRAVPDGALICVLDERGTQLSSPDFARRLAGWRDAGCPAVAFLIGGADGLDPTLRAEADAALSFGPMVWPHLLARAMLAEQLYRAVSILGGSPYHRA